MLMVEAFTRIGLWSSEFKGKKYNSGRLLSLKTNEVETQLMGDVIGETTGETAGKLEVKPLTEINCFQAWSKIQKLEKWVRYEPMEKNIGWHLNTFSFFFYFLLHR